jgi:hypothetical protein
MALLITACCFVQLMMSVCIAQPDAPGDPHAPSPIRLQKTNGGVDVFFQSQLFTTFQAKEKAKPILYPLYGPGQIPMTRNWPMRSDIIGEMQDHPHHKSMWVGHIVNGVDFWSEKGGRVEVVEIQLNDKTSSFTALSHWIESKSDQVVLSDESRYVFGGNASARWIDVTIRFFSDAQELKFEDTKEGTFAIRTHPNLQLTPVKDAPIQTLATARNSQGQQGKNIWGQKAKWVIYQGSIEGRDVAVAMFDHPNNFRHPTTWHARDYGLVAANPFGLHEFQGQPRGAGDHVVRSGESLALRYRAIFFLGKPSDQEIEEQYQAFVD